MSYWQEHPPTHVLIAAYLLGGSQRSKHFRKNNHGFNELSGAVRLAGGSSNGKLPDIYRR